MIAIVAAVGTYMGRPAQALGQSEQCSSQLCGNQLQPTQSLRTPNAAAPTTTPLQGASSQNPNELPTNVLNELSANGTPQPATGPADPVGGWFAVGIILVALGVLFFIVDWYFWNSRWLKKLRRSHKPVALEADSE